MKIALYGGSFNPPHLQHMMAVQALADRFDEVWVIPCQSHAFGKDLEPWSDRLQMCWMVLYDLAATSSAFNKARVIRATEVYTADLVERLRAERPQDEFAVVFGSDILEETHHWHRWDDLTKLAETVILGRDGHDVPGRTFEINLAECSSTQFRKLMAQGKFGDARVLVPGSVWGYIESQRLYGHPGT